MEYTILDISMKSARHSLSPYVFEMNMIIFAPHKKQPPKIQAA